LQPRKRPSGKRRGSTSQLTRPPSMTLIATILTGSCPWLRHRGCRACPSTLYAASIGTNLFSWVNVASACEGATRWCYRS